MADTGTRIYLRVSLLLNLSFPLLRLLSPVVFLWWNPFFLSIQFNGYPRRLIYCTRSSASFTSSCPTVPSYFLIPFLSASITLVVPYPWFAAWDQPAAHSRHSFSFISFANVAFEFNQQCHATGLQQRSSFHFQQFFQRYYFVFGTFTGISWTHDSESSQAYWDIIF